MMIRFRWVGSWWPTRRRTRSAGNDSSAARTRSATASGDDAIRVSITSPSPGDLDRGVRVRGRARHPGRRPLLVHDLDREAEGREGVDNPVPVRPVPVADPQAHALRGEGQERRPDETLDRLRGRCEPGVDDLAIADEGHAGLRPRVHADDELPPLAAAPDDLERFRDRVLHILHRHDRREADAGYLRQRRQHGADIAGDRILVGQGAEREVAGLERGHHVVVQAEVLRQDAEDLAHGVANPQEGKNVPPDVGFPESYRRYFIRRRRYHGTRPISGGRPIETETKSILVKDAVVIFVAVGGLLALYAVIQVVSFLANIRP